MSRLTSPRLILAILWIAAFALLSTGAFAQPWPTSMCIGDRSGNLNCTANDIEIASVTVNNNVTTCRAGDPVTIDLTANLHVNAQNRHDVGIFLALDGRSPLTPSSAGGSASCKVSGIPMSPTPFADLDSNICGDFDRDGLPQGTSASTALGTMTVLCQPGSTGRLVIPAVVSWDVGGSCPTPAQAPGGVAAQYVTASSPSKCESGILADIPVTVQGKISITKQTEPNGATGSFGFTATGTGVTPTSFSLSDNGTQVLTTGDLTTFASSYVVTEAALAGFSSSAQISCVDRDGDPQTSFVTVDTANRQLTLSMSANPTAGLSEVYCTFTNTKNSSITVVKNTVGGDGTFAFTGSSSFNITTSGGTGQYVISPLSPGQYSVSESAPSGWDLSALVCNDPTGDTTVASGTASIALAAGENVTCTFTDTARGSLQIAKTTVGGDGTFSFSSAPALSGLSTITTSGGTSTPVTMTVVPGSYSVTETVPTGWDLTAVNCTPSAAGSLSGSTETITVAAGQSVSCTFVDTKRASITVVKNTTGGDGTFNFSATGGISFGITTTSGNASNTTALASVTPSSPITITESAQSGWSFQSASCKDAGTSAAIGSPATSGVTLTPAAGQSIICTFNDVKLATLSIYKHTLPHAAQLFNFGAAGLTPNSFQLKDDGSNPNFITFPNVTPGSGSTYSVTEVAQAGYVLTALTCSDVSDPDVARRSTVNLATGTVSPHLDPGETLTCTFTNTEIQPGSITITKHAIGSDGSFQFTNSGGVAASATNPTVFTLVTSGANHTAAQLLTSVPAATYDIVENVPAGWDLTTPISCVVTAGTNTSITPIANGVRIVLGTTGPNVDAVACEFIDTKRASITIVKASSPQDAQPFTFNTVSNPATTALPASFTLADSGTPPNSQAFTDRIPGTYTVTEAAASNWVLMDISCTGGANVTTNVSTATASIGLQPGENVSCTFANSKNGMITIAKHAVGGTQNDRFEFTGALAGSIPSGQTLSGTFGVGTYSVSESVLAGWDLTGIACSGGTVTMTGAAGGGNGFEAGDNTVNITLATGDSSTCTFTNTKRGSIRVVKRSLGADASFSFGGTRSFMISTVGGQGQDSTTYAAVAPGTYTVTESVPAGWRVSDLTCSNASAVDVAGATAHVSVAAGEAVTCTFTDIRNGTITITKRLNGDDPVTTIFSVPTTLDPAGTISILAQPAAPASHSFTNVPAGTYVVTEMGPPSGWVSTGISCTDPTGDTVVNAQGRSATIHLSAGEGVECIFDNVSLGNITVNVVSVGGTGYFGFSTPGLGPDYIEGTQADGVANGRSFHNLMPGYYQIIGTGPVNGPGWRLYGVQCATAEAESYWTISGSTTSIHLPHGEDIVCTYYYRLGGIPVQSGGEQGIPTMGEWGMIIMATLLAFAAMFTLKRRAAGSPGAGR